jgi:hypothetical protein
MQANAVLLQEKGKYSIVKKMSVERSGNYEESLAITRSQSNLIKVITEAIKHGPQIIRGIETVVIVSLEDYREMKQILSSNEAKEKNKLSDFFKNSPIYGVNLDLPRN